jgi:hypothetical protein
MYLTAIAIGSLVSGCSAAKKLDAADPTPSAPPPTAAGPLKAPKTTPVEDDAYFRDLATVDPSLSTYVNAEQAVALRALLVDGSAFCAFLGRGGGIDNAMEAVVIGADSVEPKTHLPRSVATFNAIDATALIALCPGELRLVPPTARRHIRELEQVLTKSPQATVTVTG